MRFVRKIRETIMAYVHGVDGAFAIYCQRLFDMHRLPFFGASSLVKWQVGSPATTTQTKPYKSGGVYEGRKRHFCRLVGLDVDAGT